MGIFSNFVGKTTTAAVQQVAAGVAKVDLLATLSAGKKQINTLIDLSNEVSRATAADLIIDVAFAMKAVYENLENDPRDVKTAEDFIVYHAPKAVEVIRLYAKGEIDGSSTADEKKATEEVMRQMKTSFETLLAKCKENDVEGFSVQTETLRRILELETPTLSRASVEVNPQP